MNAINKSPTTVFAGISIPAVLDDPYFDEEVLIDTILRISGSIIPGILDL